MIAKTVLQKKVVELSAKLPAITEKQKQFAFDKSFDMYVSRSRKTLFCLECGHSWKEQSSLMTAIACTCPSCGMDLKLKQEYCRVYKDAEYFSILTVKGGIQVVRMFYVTKFMKKLHTPEYSIHEVMQHWIDETGKNTLMSKKVQGLSRYYDQWILESELEVRQGSEKSNMRYGLAPFKIFPKRKILPVIKRNGFKGNFHGLTPQSFFRFILQDPRAETLLKAGQLGLFQFRSRNAGPHTVNKDEHWHSIKICIRNNYIIKDPSMWFDYLDLLSKFGKDLHNPKFVCPLNLKKEHDRLVQKKRAADKKKKIEKLRAKMDADQRVYAAEKSKYLDLVFRDGEIFVKPLESVHEFMNEGDELGHCVFTNEYYKRKESLIMSARIDDKPIETIEISLNKMEVVQSRGLKNKATEYHDRILNLVKSNIKVIQKAQLTV